MDSEQLPPDKRPIGAERRGTDLLNESTRTRLAVLETSVAHQDARITDMELYQRAISTKLTTKIQVDAASDVVMERTLAKAVSDVDRISANLKETNELAVEAARLADKHETMGITVLKVGSMITVILGALWALAQALVNF